MKKKIETLEAKDKSETEKKANTTQRPPAPRSPYKLNRVTRRVYTSPKFRSKQTKEQLEEIDKILERDARS